MLLELHVRDLGVLASAQVGFAPGLNVVTGETGAGKTLLMTCLGLVTGARAGAHLVSPGADEAVVEAVLRPDAGSLAALARRGIDAADELLVTRRVGADGRSRAWLQGQLVPVAALAEVCGSLVEVHGQGAGFVLARPSAQLAALDAFADTADLLSDYRAARARHRDLVAEREVLTADDRSRLRELDLLRHQVEEVERAAPSPDEEDDLAHEIARLEHTEQLTSAGGRGAELVGSEGAAGTLAEAAEALADAARIDPSARPLVERLAALGAEATEVAWDIRGWLDGLEPDPGRLEAAHERRALLATLRRKYGDTLAEVIAATEEARARIASMEGTDARREEIGPLIEAAAADLEAAAERLSAKRRRAAAELADHVMAELPHLALGQATFDIGCDRGPDTETGRDQITFRFSSHPSRPPAPIGKVASGGELSRAMIAVTLALATAHEVPVLVFDEADAGVGGSAALDLARRMARLGATHQVLCVTHLPQLAAFADRHHRVTREPDAVRVDVVEGEERLGEISRMLAGLGASDLARAHAAELVGLAAEARGAVQAG